MKHQKKARKLSRDKDQRKALFRTMLGSLIMHEKIETTEAKAKELKGKIDKIVNKAKKTKDEKRKLAVSRDLRTLIPAMAVKKIIGEFLDKFEKRGSGYIRIIKLAPRKSDGAKKAVIEFV
ncbi:MAG: 50S ribosomal protein L17 [Candidatus Moranbacteria bacterium RIFOXYA12_FULL_44_15]|nr:MAG: 50S ribosomal protein L17 [Candidatus Moranbacteria bacterium RIFOXYA12_FULL_44_15]OGI35541.1 MAG: 50S ribosomal protein L17 [Candidatus Moranbacteria bacterium RIFOXYA2_FULL_43_15]